MSTLFTSNSYYANTGDNTIFRAMGTAVSNAFANSGWVKANDAGQIDWTTVVANGTIYTIAGSEIWRMNDALQNTSPIYVRVDYGTGNGTNCPRWYFTVGTGSNGSLGLTGVLSPNNFIQATYGSSTVALPCYFSGSNNRIIIAPWQSGSNAACFSIERTPDANGADTSEGALIGWQTQGTSWSQCYWNAKVGPGPVETSAGIFSQSQGNVAVPPGFNWYPIYFSKGAFFPYPSRNLVVASTNQVTPLTVITLTHYGTARNFVVETSGVTNRSGISASTMPLCFMWE